MEKADVALYHRVLRRENFEKAAKDLVSLVYAAEKKEPGMAGEHKEVLQKY